MTKKVELKKYYVCILYYTIRNCIRTVIPVDAYNNESAIAMAIAQVCANEKNRYIKIISCRSGLYKGGL